MGVNLTKGQKVSLTKTEKGLQKIKIGLGWDTNRFDTGESFDLDSAVFLLGENGKVSAQDDFIFYGNLEHKSGAVKHLGDNRTGDGEGDDEQIFVDLSKVPQNIKKIVFTVTIYDVDKRRQNFGQVSNAFIRILNEEKNTEILKYDLDEDFSIETAVIFGEIYNHNGEWKFNAIGNGFQGGLAALCSNFGIDID